MRIRLDLPLDLSEIKEAVGCYASNTSNARIEYITTDTRELMPGDLFIALKGELFDGEDFAEDAARLGAYVISSRNISGGLTASSGKDALLALASYYKKKLCRLKCTLAITGSVGKTTTKDFSGIILSKKYSVTSSEKNYNNYVGAALTVLSAAKDTELLILELGMNHKGEIKELSESLEPDIAIITNVGSAHIGNLGSREAIAEAKLEILSGMKKGLLIAPYDEPLLKEAASYTFSLGEEGADFRFEESGGRIYVYKGNRLILESVFGISEKHLFACLAPAVVSALLLGVPTRAVSEAISSIDRSVIKQKFIKVGELTVYSDLYNASEESVLAALSFIDSLADYEKKSILLGTVLESGRLAESIHKRLGRASALIKPKDLYFFGEHSDKLMQGALEAGFPAERIITEPSDTNRLADIILDRLAPSELLLVKGSRGVRLERIVDRLMDRGGEEKRDRDA